MTDNAISSTQHKVSEALGLWEPKRTLTLEAARRHSHRIVIMRRVLMGLAAVLVLGLTYEFLTQKTAFIVEDNPDESVKMVNPRYSGRTSDGLPYVLTADAANRTTQNDKEVELINPVLNFIRQDGLDASTVKAEFGRYNDVSQVLELRQAVNLKTDDGYTCLSTHARIFAAEKRIEGDEAIRCTGSFGTVDGQAYEILENYTLFVFKNGTQAYLEGGNASGGTASGGGDL